MDHDSLIGRHCQKCGHIRKREDEGPDYACAACGGVYTKVRLALHQREEAVRETARHADFAVLPAAALPPTPVLRESVAAERRRVALVQAGYLLQLVPLGITALVGAVIARGIVAAHPSSWLASHSRWQLRTFWTALVIGLVLAMLTALLVGGARLADRMGDGSTPGGRSGAGWMWLPATALWLWVMYRVARGWLLLLRGESV